MPINEITAASFIIVRYTTDIPYTHLLRLYFDALPTYLAVTDTFQYQTYTDATHLTGWTVKDIVKEVFTRATNENGNMPALTINEVEVWRSEPNAPNVFLGLDGADYSDVTGGAANSIAAAYWMLVMKAQTRAQFRLMFFDTADARPQRYPGINPPVVDNGFLTWFLTRGTPGFVTNDNLPLTIFGSANTGYNRKLARSYGRSIQP